MVIVISDDEVRVNLAANLGRLLHDRGITQSELARRTGDTQVRISNACRGVHVPGVAMLVRIAEALDVSIDRLVAPVPAEKSRRTA